MRSDDVDTLQLLVNAATDWRTAALVVGVEVNIITTQINDQDVILSWNGDLNIWDIRTQ